MGVLQVLKKHAFFGLVFTIAKGTVYFTPLLLADFLSQEDFGILEYALAGLGMIVNTIINLGVPGAYPYFILKKNSHFLSNAFSLHPLILIIPFLVNQILFLVLNLGISYYLAFNVSFIIANQMFYSTQLKSHEKPIPAVLLDSGIYILLLVYFIGFQVELLRIDIEGISNLVFLYSLVYVIYGIYQFYKVDKDRILKKYLKVLKFGVHLLISTFIIFLITTSGRILVEFFFDFELVGVYAFYFRLSAVVVMLHQIINITFFKKIYTLDPRILDKYFYMFFIAIFILTLCCFYIAPLLISRFSSYFMATYSTYKGVYFLLSVQMVMWIGTALNSNIINRENLAFKNNISLTFLLLISSILLFALKEHLTLSLLTIIHFTVIFITCLSQFLNLYQKGYFFKKSVIALSTIYLFSVSYYFLMF